MGWYGTKPLESDDTAIKLRKNKIFNSTELIGGMKPLEIAQGLSSMLLWA